MKIRNVLLSFIFCLFVVSSSFAYDSECSFDKVPELQSKVLNFKNSIPPIYNYVIGEGVVSINGSDGKFLTGTQRGEGFSFVWDGVVITAQHIITPENIVISYSHNYRVEVPIVNVKQHTILAMDDFGKGGVLLQLEYISSFVDGVALLLPKSDMGLKSLDWAHLGSTYTSIGEDRISAGDCVFILNQKRDENYKLLGNYELQVGKVLLPDSNMIAPGSYLGRNNFIFDIPVRPGDSGSPVFAFNNGRVEIIGVVEGYVPGTLLNFAMRIDLILRQLELLRKNE